MRPAAFAPLCLLITLTVGTACIEPLRETAAHTDSTDPDSTETTPTPDGALPDALVGDTDTLPDLLDDTDTEPDVPEDTGTEPDVPEDTGTEPDVPDDTGTEPDVPPQALRNRLTILHGAEQPYFQGGQLRHAIKVLLEREVPSEDGEPRYAPVSGATLDLSEGAEANALEPVGAMTTNDLGHAYWTVTPPLTTPHRHFKVRYAGSDTAPTPVEVATSARATTVAAIATGPNHSCAVTGDGDLVCWGLNGATTSSGDTPIHRPMTHHVSGGQHLEGTYVPTPGPVTAVSIGGWRQGSGPIQDPRARPHAFTCITVRGEGSSDGVWCVGDGPFLGNDPSGGSDVWVRVQWDAEPAAIAPLMVDQPPLVSGQLHSCAFSSSVDGAEVVCWGQGDAGQLGVLGLGAGVTHGVAVQDTPPSVSGSRDLVAGPQQTCLRSSGTTARRDFHCWGNNKENLMGRITPDPFSSVEATPIRFAEQLPPLCPDVTLPASLDLSLRDSANMTALATGLAHTCALVTFPANLPLELTSLCAIPAHSGAFVVCAGANDAMQRGVGETTVPVNWVRSGGAGADLFSGLTTIVAGDAFTCSLDAGGQVLCWGGNRQGQLGVSPTVTAARSEPGLVPGLPGAPRFVAQLAAGPDYACVLTQAVGAPTEVAIHCWGGNTQGESGGPCSIGGAQEPCTGHGARAIKLP